MKLPSLPTSPNIIEALSSFLPANTEILVLGNNKLATKLFAKGFKISTTINPSCKYKAMVLYDLMPKQFRKSVFWLESKLDLLDENGVVCIVEKSIPLDKRSFISKILIHYEFVNPPEQISQISLSVGLKNISQLWSQGFSSLLVTKGEKSFNC